MKHDTKITIALLLLAALLLYVVNCPAKDFEYKPIKLTNDVTISIDSKVGNLISVSVEDAENAPSILGIDCQARVFYYGLINGNGGEKFVPDVYPFREAEAIELKIIKYTCSKFVK